MGLAYSSDGGVLGGLGAGWSLSAGGVIAVDTSAGAVRPEWPGGGTAEAPRNFTSPHGLLVRDDTLPVNVAGAVGYRAISDAGFARFEYLGGVSSPFWWRVFYSDGTTANFGLKEQHPWSFSPLVRVAVDDGGGDPQELRYSYTTVGRTTAAPAAGQPREYLLSQIAYEAPGEDSPYAKVSFHYADPAFCGNPATMSPVGSRVDYRPGFGLLSGTRKLTEVRTWTERTAGTGSDLRDVYTLGYNAETEVCEGPAAQDRGAPYRELASVQRRSYRPQVDGQDGPSFTDLPSTRFTYGKAGSYVKSEHYGPETPVGVSNLALPESVESNQQALVAQVDEDDPGVPVFKQPFSTCVALFCPTPREPGETDPSEQPNLGNGAWVLATGQGSGESVSVVHVDINGDNRPDMLKRPGGAPKTASAVPQTGGCDVEVFLNNGNGYAKSDAFPTFSLAKAMGDIPVKATTPPSGAGELLCSLNRSFSSNASGGYRGDPSTPCAQASGWGAQASWGSMQQARHAILDWDGDGRKDLLTQTIASVDCPYVSTQGIPAPRFSASMSAERGAAQPDPHWATEYQDVLVGPDAGALRPITKRQKYLYVYRNTGSGFATSPVRVSASSRTAPSGLPGEGLLHDNVAKIPEASVMAGFAGKGDEDGLDVDLGGPKSQLLDINGDGFLDLVFRQRTTNLGPAPVAPVSWPSTDLPTAPAWRTPFQLFDDSQDPDPGAPGQWTIGQARGLQDVNGDGLPDLVEHETDQEGMKVSFNTGFGFATAAEDGQVMFSEDVAETDLLDSSRVGQLTGTTWHGYSPIGERWGRTGFQDLDGDGLGDVLFYDHESGQARLYSGGGRQWVGVHPADAQVAKHLAGVVRGVGTGFGGTTQEFGDRADYRYLATHQAIDINGDGLRDLIGDSNSDGVLTVRYARSVLGTADQAAPPRLMRTMTNGAGATTTISYDRDVKAGKWVASTTTVDPGRGQPPVTTDYRYLEPAYTANPYGRRVFRGYKEIHTVRRGASGVADDLTHVTRHDYSALPAGVPTLSATVMGQTVPSAGMPDNQPGVMSVTTHTHQFRPVGGRAPGMRSDFPVSVALPDTTVTRTCTGVSGQTFSACRDSAPAVTQQTTWEPRSVDGAFAMFLPTRSETRFTNADGKDEIHRSVPTFNLRYTATVYKLAPAATSESVLLDGQSTDLGSVRYTYADANYRLVQTVTVDDASSAVDKVTRLAHHPLSAGALRGLLHRVWQPEQVHRHGVDSDTDPGFSEFGYDGNGVHATRVVNPLGHTATMVVDPGTGQALETRGPNYSCPDGPDPGTALDPPSACSFAQADAADLTELARVHIDGLGRTVKAERYPIGDTTQSDGVETFTATFDDLAHEQSRGPVATTVRSLIADRAGQQPLYGTVVTTTDGLGRALRERTTQDPGVIRQVDYAYNAQGLLARITAPRGDGGVNKATTGTISVINTYDGLGRVTSVADQITDADGRVHPADPARTWVYDGLSTTSEQIVNAADEFSPGRYKKVSTDAIGRVSTVAERWQPFHGDAVTRYAYPAPNQSTITDPDGVVTTMTHDFSGNRTAVERSGRTWSYGYDRNNNPTTVVEPHPAGQSAAYTHTLAYDDLDRVITATPATRDLTAQEKTRFAFGHTAYSYDQAHPSLSKEAGHAGATIGRLTATTSYMPGPTAGSQPVPAAVATTRFDKWGTPEALDQRLPLLDTHAGIPGLEGVTDRLAVTTTADEAGIAQSVQYGAINPAGQTTFTAPTVHSTGFDHDGAPTSMRIDLPTGAMGVVLERNSAGQVVTRRTNTANNANYAPAQTRYTHDPYGRITSLQAGFPSGDNIPGDTTPLDPETQRYHQSLTYYDNGQIGTITEQLGDADQLTATTTYEYNHRHELISAIQEDDTVEDQTANDQIGGVGYYAHIDTTASGRLSFANITTLNNPNAPVRLTHRNVDYQYGADNDPLRLNALTTADGTELASYAYDEAGNTTRRTTTNPDGTPTTYHQRWDAPSSLREVTNAITGGTETYHHTPGGRLTITRDSAGAITKIHRQFGAQETVYTPGQPTQRRQTVTLGGETIGRIDTTAGTSTFEHYLTSPQNHHVLALDIAGNTNRAVSYGAFGEILRELHNPNAPANGKYPREFHGKTYDQTSGLHHYGAREYDPLALHWSSPDPLYTPNPDLNPTQPTRANLYTFNANNPVNNVDPSGLDPTCVHGNCDATADAPVTGGEVIHITGDAGVTPENPGPTGIDGAGGGSIVVESSVWDYFTEEITYYNDFSGKMETGNRINQLASWWSLSSQTANYVYAGHQPRVGKVPSLGRGVRPFGSGGGGGGPIGGGKPGPEIGVVGPGVPSASPYPIGKMQKVYEFIPNVSSDHLKEQRAIGKKIGQGVRDRKLSSGKIDAVIAEINASSPANQTDAAIRADEAFRALHGLSGRTSGIHESGGNLIVTQAHPGAGRVVVIDPNATLSAHKGTVYTGEPQLGLPGSFIGFKLTE